MKVLLKEDVDNIGYAGEVHAVADGYGRNYLIPQGMAVKASAAAMKQAEVWSNRAAARREELKAEYEELSKRIVDVVLEFTARAGDTGKLYGSITTTQIADEMNELLGTDIDRRKVGSEPLRELGSHKVVVRLSGDFQPELTVNVAPEGGIHTVVDVEETVFEGEIVELTEDGEVIEVDMTVTEIEEIDEIDGEIVEIDSTVTDIATYVDGELVEVDEIVEVTDVEVLDEIDEEVDEEDAA